MESTTQNDLEKEASLSEGSALKLTKKNSNKKGVNTARQPGALAYGAHNGIDGASFDDSSAASNGNFMVEASLVETPELNETSNPEPPATNMSVDLVAAEVVKPIASGAMRRRKLMIAVLVLGVLFLGGGVVAGILVGIRDDPASRQPLSGSMPPSMSPTPTLGPQEYVKQLKALLPDFSTTAIEQDQIGPQAKAFAWLTLDESFSNYTDETLIQRFAMATFYFATDGPNWRKSVGWLDYTDDCSWHNEADNFFDSVPCKNGKRIALTLQDNQLLASLPPEIGLLSHLEMLALYDNQLGGQIPSEVGRLTSLKSLLLYGNDWTGTIPTTIGRMTELRWFDIAFNAMDSK